MSLLHKITSLAARRYEREKALAIAQAAAQMATKLGQPTKVVVGKPSPQRQSGSTRGSAGAGQRSAPAAGPGARRVRQPVGRKRVKRDADGSITIEDYENDDDGLFLDAVFLDESPFIGDLAAR